MSIEPRTRREIPDEELVRRFQSAGDAECFTTLFVRHRKPIYIACREFFSDNTAAEDATQETFLRVNQTIGHFREGNFCGWLTRIAKNVCIDEWRKRRPEIGTEELQPDTLPDGGTLEHKSNLHFAVEKLRQGAAKKNSCPDSESLCTFAENRVHDLARYAIAAHLGECSECAALYLLLSGFTQSSPSMTETEWSAAEKRLENWIDAFLTREEASNSRGKDPLDKDSATGGWKRQLYWKRQWILGSFAAIASAVIIVFLILLRPWGSGIQTAVTYPPSTTVQQQVAAPSTIEGTDGESKIAKVVKPNPENISSPAVAAWAQAKATVPEASPSEATAASPEPVYSPTHPAAGERVIDPTGIHPWMSAPAQTAPADSLESQLNAKYKPVKVDEDSNGLAILEPGTVLEVKKGGILAFPVTNPRPLASTYKDGSIHAPNSLVTEMLEQENRSYTVGEKVYVTRIEVDQKNSKVGLFLIECDSCNGVQDPSNLKAELVVQCPNGYLDDTDVGQVAALIEQVLAVDTGDSQQAQISQGGQSNQGGRQADAPAQPPHPPRVIHLGQTIDQVKGMLGDPEKIVDRGIEQIYMYKDLEITFVNGKVTYVQ